jgi:hypothetical protein
MMILFAAQAGVCAFVENAQYLPEPSPNAGLD